MHSSKAIKALMDGGYYGRVEAYLRYDKKAPLNDDDKIIFDRIERTKELWLQHKEDRMVINLIRDEFELSQAQAYNYLNDAKSIYALFISYNEMTELILLKERIDKGYKLAEEDPKAFGRLYGVCLEMELKWNEAMNEAMERNKPKEEKSLIIIYHSEWKKLPGLTEEHLQEWDKEFDQLELKSRSKFKFVEDVEFTETN